MLVLQEFILKPLAKVAPEMIPDISDETVKNVYALLNVYGIQVNAPQLGRLLAVCDTASLMEHSCLPNARRFLSNSPIDGKRSGRVSFKCQVILRATRDIRK